jgi:hypothetical protein
MSERARRRHSFKTFYTTNLTDTEGIVQKVEFDQQNRFEGRSAYFHYYPTDTLLEQRLEAQWYEA